MTLAVLTMFTVPVLYCWLAELRWKVSYVVRAEPRLPLQNVRGLKEISAARQRGSHPAENSD